VLLAIAFVAGQEDNLVNTNVDRTLDLVSHIPKETITVTIENRGTKATYYDYYVEPQHVNDVAYVGAVVSKIDFFYRNFINFSVVYSRSKVKIMMIKVVYQ
jgi:hypothetical protein